MRVLLAGQKRFGRDVLELILKRGWDVAAVSCPAAEDDKLHIAALNRRLPILTDKLCASIIPAELDLIVAAHCHSYLSGKTRSRATLGAVGYHPSLLPRHRGRDAIEWTLRFGEKIAGGSVFWLNDVVDGGDVAAQEGCHVCPGDTALTLWVRDLAPLGLKLFSRVFDHLDQGIVVRKPQDQEVATWEPALGNVPPLWRPDVPQLGESKYRVVREVD